MREDAPLQAEIERVEAIILADDRPVTVQLVLDVVSLTTGFRDVLSRTDREPLRSASEAEFGKQPLAQINCEALRLLLRSESKFIPRQFSGSEQQKNLIRAERRHGGKLNERLVGRASHFHGDVIAKAPSAGICIDLRLKWAGCSQRHEALLHVQRAKRKLNFTARDPGLSRCQRFSKRSLQLKIGRHGSAKERCAQFEKSIPFHPAIQPPTRNLFD